jgi:hypothetical protein
MMKRPGGRAEGGVVRGTNVRGTRLSAKRVAVVGVAVLAAGGAMLATAVVASAATPSISFTQSAPIGPTSNLSTAVSGSGFADSSLGALFECNTASGQPTIDVSVTILTKTADLGQVPVSCGSETPTETTAKGKLPAGSIIGLQEGALGPPATGTDSSGGAAATDAANYPCPPTSAQASAQCVVMYVDAAGNTASAPITFASSSSTSTTGSSSCTGQSKSATGTNTTTGASATLTVNPATCLVGGQVVQVTGTGLAASSEGSILECNSDSGQPTVSFAGESIPISCTKIAIVSTTSAGALSTNDESFMIETGTTGPPTTGTDSSGGSAATDAANYPCPPTAAQVTAGDICEIVFGDAGGDAVIVPISFNSGGGTSTTTTTTPTGGTTTTTAAQSGQTTTTAVGTQSGQVTTTTASQSGQLTTTTVASVTSASSSDLAFTGPGPLLWITGLLGMFFVLIGGSLLLMVDAPRQVLHAAVRRVVRRH